jgi:hypothetical protein
VRGVLIDFITGVSYVCSNIAGIRVGGGICFLASQCAIVAPFMRWARGRGFFYLSIVLLFS